MIYLKSSFNKPLLSIVIPAFNEENSIGECLKSIQSQDFNLPFEIIVIDGPSSDNTSLIAKRYGARVYKLRERGINIAWLTGVEKSRAELIVFTEADTSVPRNWLRKIYENFLLNPKAVGIVGRYKFKNKSILNHFVLPMMLFADVFHYLWTGYYAFRGTNFAVRKKFLIKCGNFDKDIKTHGDVELSKRISRFGKIVYLPDLNAETSNRNFKTLGNFIKFLIRLFRAVYYIEIVQKPKKISKMFDIR